MSETELILGSLIRLSKKMSKEQLQVFATLLISLEKLIVSEKDVVVISEDDEVVVISEDDESVKSVTDLFNKTVKPVGLNRKDTLVILQDHDYLIGMRFSDACKQAGLKYKLQVTHNDHGGYDPEILSVDVDKDDIITRIVDIGGGDRWKRN
jgi:hypothetical protein